MNNLGIYIHIPFCKKKCDYCDFISFANCEKSIDEYVNSLKKEIIEKSKDKEVQDRYIDTIYIGGGTPSFIDANYIKELLELIRNNYNVNKDVEITIEVNPGTVIEEKLKAYKEAKINRISIGLQSTNDMLLKTIGRIHTFEEFLNTYNLARKIGFNNINVDLMLGLPNQDLEILEESVNEIIKLNPEHISIYSLILEEGTKLTKYVEEGKLILPNEEQERKMYWKVKEILKENGYNHYEISNFSKEGFESKHNVNCWNQNEYIGFGLAAHSYLNNKRFCNTSNMIKYIENINNNLNGNGYKDNIEILEEQNENDKQKEYMMLGLRLIEGVNIQKFKNKFGKNPIYVFRKELEELVNKQLIEIDLNNIRLTNKGLDLANIVWEQFV